MKKKITIALFAALAAVVVIDAFNNNVFTYTGGAPTGRTGSPGDGASCSCHNSPVAKTGWITSDIPTAGYTPGTTYTLTATCTNANQSKFGFEISPQNSTGTLLGTLIATNTTETKLIGSGKYITHTSSGATGSGSKVWTFQWTAPVAGTGTVTFYGSFVGGYSNVFSSTLQANENSCTPPVATISAGGATTFCQGGSVVLTASTGSGYTWSNNATTQSITVTTAGTYFVTVGSGGCTTKSASTTVTVNAAPTATITPSSTAKLCQNDSVKLTASTGSSYLWSNNATTASITVKTAGAYTVKVTGTNTCSATSSATIVSVNPLPAKPTITKAGDSLTSSSAQTYLWLLNKVAVVSNATSKTFTPKVSGLYSVTITDANGCTNTSDEMNVTVTGIETLTSMSSISVFPNPFNHKTTLSYSLAHSSQVTIEVYNLLGEKMNTLANERQARGNFQYTIFANELGAGVYFIKCKINEETRVVKLIAVE